MADNYVIRKATLDGIAAQTMTLNGTTAAMTTEQMEQAVADANTEVTAQAAKIAELSTILDGKAGGGTPTYETCTVELDVIYGIDQYTACVVNSGNLEFITVDANGVFERLYINDVLCGSVILVQTTYQNAYYVTQTGYTESVLSYNGTNKTIIALKVGYDSATDTYYDNVTVSINNVND